MTPSVEFLKDALSVTPADDGRVAVTVLLPPALVRDYCRFLDSIASFFQTVNRKSIHATVAARSAQAAPERDHAAAAYTARVVSAFDKYAASGMDRKEAVKRIAADLRAEGHPWRFPELVRSTLVAAGRGGRPGRPRRGES
jgi:hypothetical protein